MFQANKLSGTSLKHIKILKEIYSSWLKLLTIPEQSPLNVMDVGCGNGRILTEVLRPLLPTYLSEIHAVDEDPNLITHCVTTIDDPKIFFHRLDMNTKILPNELQNKFHLIFSTFSLISLSRDMRQVLINSYKLLKPEGELLYMFFLKENPLFMTYKNMCGIKKWEPYLKEFKSFVPFFTSNYPDSELELKFAEAGLMVLDYEFRNDLLYESTPRHIIEYSTSTETVLKIPENERKDFMKDLVPLLLSQMETNFEKSSDLDKLICLRCPLVIVHARRLMTHL